MPALPTRTLGHVDDSTYGALLSDALEHVGDVQWPTSTRTYSMMRRDPQLTGVVDAYQLLVRRASWTLDPAGCRPEVCRLVADDLGLPLAGQDQPGAARVRGVSWREHLRMVTESFVFGHYGFELEADVSSGQARLAGLWERPPHTISRIHADGKTGALKGVSQTPAWKEGAPEIRAEHLAWYCFDKGVGWTGTSLLRPGFGPWLIKRELQAALATGSRRFSMGVPLVEWATDARPTPEQHAQAHAVASAARGGETAGAALPPGARLVLAGLQGSVPDTLGFLKWIDSQLSGMALARFMDLGESSNGSRALGESFVEFFTLAVQTAADDIAEVATRQVAARLVEWNYGPDEPVPAVRVADVRSRREVTAEALKTLLDSGGLSSDPGLEEYIRREWRLPQREQASPPAPVPTPSPAPPVAASRPRSKRRQPSGQMALFAAAEDPDPAPDYAQIQAQWEQAKADLLAQWPVAAQPVVDELVQQAEGAVEADDLGLLGALAVSAGVVAAVSLLIGDAGVGLAVEAAAGVVAEAAAQGVTVAAPDTPGAERVRQTADAVAAVIAAGYASGAARAALQVAGADRDTVSAAVRAHLDELGTSVNGLVGDNVGALLSAAQNAGRLAVLEAAPAATYRAVEVNDKSRCGPCSEIADTEFASLAEAVAAYPASGFRDCDGKGRCRGFLFPLFT
jgi:hypothetical protein